MSDSGLQPFLGELWALGPIPDPGKEPASPESQMVVICQVSEGGTMSSTGD